MQIEKNTEKLEKKVPYIPSRNIHHIYNIESIVGPNANRYVKKFRKRRKNPIGWNWCAFFFSLPWMLYRKMYGVFSVTFISTVCLAVVRQYMANTGYFMSAGQDLAAAIVLFVIPCCLIPALFADSFYRNHVLRIQEKAKVHRWRLKDIEKAGGVNKIAPVIFILMILAAFAMFSGIYMYEARMYEEIMGEPMVD